jgi:putative heme-binding domain-containing protein
MQRTTFPLIRENIAHRLAADIDQDSAPVSTILEIAAANKELTSDLLRGVAAAVNGRKKVPVPASWKSVRNKLPDAADVELTDSLNTIGIAFNDAETIAALRRAVEDASSASDARIRALKLLITAHPPGLSGELRALIKDPALTLEAVRGLAAYDDPKGPAAILERFPDFTPEQKTAAINTLASRLNYAQALIAALESKHVKPTDISAVQARQLIGLRDDALNERVRAIWGDIRQTTGEKRKTMDHLRAILIPAIAKADVQNGKAIFTKTCATCHVLFGEGKRIGPELTGSNRKNLEYLVENIVDPSAVVGAEFRTKIVQLNDGRVLNGIIREQNDNTITLETADTRMVIDRKSIDDLSVSDKSLMPDGLLQPLTDVQIRDLIGYLMSN